MMSAISKTNTLEIFKGTPNLYVFLSSNKNKVRFSENLKMNSEIQFSVSQKNFQPNWIKFDGNRNVTRYDPYGKPRFSRKILGNLF
jgi:hypothetical protein